MIVETLIAWHAQRAMYIVFSAAATGLFVGAMDLVERGYWPLLSPGMVVVSLGVMVLLRRLFEPPLERSFFDPRVMSWCFVVGNSFVIPAALWFGGRGWQGVTMTDGEYVGTMIVSVLVAVGTMIAFRKFDGDRYRSVEWESSLFSPTKVWLDFVLMPVTVGVMIWLLMPQLILQLVDPERVERPGDLFAAAVFVVAYVVLVIVDGLNPPDPRRQHRRWNRKRFRAITA